MEPSDQKTLALVSAIGPRKSAARISRGLAPTSSAVPRKPVNNPTTTRQPRDPEPPGITESKNAIQRATVTTNTLVTPEGVYCSAQTTKALPPASSRTPA